MRGRDQATARLHARAAELDAEREETAREAAAQERARIARELHDVVSHGMSIIVVQADAAEAALGKDPELARPPVAVVKQAARDSLSDMRRMLGLLRETEREAAASAHGVAQIPGLVERVRSAGLSVTFGVSGTSRALPSEVDLTVYRVVQEALTNAVRHAPGGLAEVRLVYGNGSVSVAAENDRAELHAHGGDGHGLQGMKERVELLGGDFEAGPVGPDGFRVYASLPA